MPIETIAFDLDDTLVNTSELLVPAASQQAFEILVANGLNLSLQECENYRKEMIKTISHKDLFIWLAEKYGSEKTISVTDQAIQAFYAPQLPEDLHLIDGAEENLNYLYKKYKLYLVTAGYQKGQMAKIDKLGIKKFFQKIFIVNSLEGERKYHAFQKIIEIEKHSSQNLLCIGNSLSSEIKDGKEIGALTCYFEFGEDRGIDPKHEKYIPTYHITNIKDLIKTCHL